ncbi:MAG TPA: ferrochelatase [Candidatus Polarisedimenticolia bacterium]|jgi:ferrochelatase|nr:ferrochelatase [Candidatus Polarisedimenticolia bacterium]
MAASGGTGHDAVLLLAFGGPVGPRDVRPFLDNVLRGKPIPKERYEEVVRHYEEVGGASPLNRLTFAQAEGLRDLLARDGPGLPVYVGMRHWEPFIAETLTAMAREGRRRAVGIVLAAHRSAVSWDAYLDAVAEARNRLGAEAPEIDFVPPWSDHPLFIEALAARTLEALDRVPADRRAGASLVFTAHSIPIAMSAAAGYAEGLARTGTGVAERLGIRAWSLAYTSRSGNPRDPWLEPDVGEALQGLRRGGSRDVVLSPIGFLTDHVEVLYDLDVAARRVAGELGLGFFRAGTAGDHPAFLQLLRALVRDVIARA